MLTPNGNEEKVMKQAIRNSDIMSEFDKHARKKFTHGILVGIAISYGTFAIGIWLSMVIYV